MLDGGQVTDTEENPRAMLFGCSGIFLRHLTRTMMFYDTPREPYGKLVTSWSGLPETNEHPIVLYDWHRQTSWKLTVF